MRSRAGALLLAGALAAAPGCSDIAFSPTLPSGGDTDTGDPPRPTFDPPPPEWPEDGFAYSSGDGIWAVSSKGPQRLSSILGYLPAWSPDGGRIALSAAAEIDTYSIVVLSRDRTEARLSPYGAYDMGPSWSPDGGRIAFLSRTEDGDHLHVMDADGSRRVQLTRGPVQRPSFPAWSPDGTRIAYAWTDLSHWPSWPGIFLINPDGTDPVRISQPFLPSAGWERPAWSPDGLKLAYLAETAREIVIVNLAGGSVEHLPLDRDARNLAWSPDGVFIAFDEPCPEPMYPSPEYCLTNPIWLVRVSDGRVLPTSVQWGWGPAWVP